MHRFERQVLIIVAEICQRRERPGGDCRDCAILHREGQHRILPTIGETGAECVRTPWLQHSLAVQHLGQFKREPPLGSANERIAEPRIAIPSRIGGER